MYLESLGREIERNHLKGTFKLSSGRDATDYYDMAPIILNKLFLAQLTQEMFMVTSDLKYDSIGCVEMCPVPLLGAMLFVLSAEYGFVVRKQSKGYGTDANVEGTIGRRVLLIEDVTSTGLSVYRAAKAVEKQGSKVLAIVTIVDRQEGCDGLLAEWDFRCLFTKESLEALS